MDRREARVVSHRSDRAARRRADRPRRLDLPAHGRSGGELSHQSESRSARPSVVPDWRPLLAASGCVDASRRDRVFGGGRHDARNVGAVEHAGGVSAAPLDPLLRMAGAAQMGNRMKTSIAVALLCLWLQPSARADVYFVTVAGLPGDAD